MLLWEDNMTVVHILTNRTSRSSELMHLLRRVWWLIDSRRASTCRSATWRPRTTRRRTPEPRGSPWDDLTLLLHVWHDLDGRCALGGPSVDRYAS